MPEVSASDLPPQFRQLALKAREAFSQRQDDLVLELCREVLRAEPGCLGVRRIQREAQIRRSGGAPSFGQKAKGSITQAGFLFKKKPDAQGGNTMERAESMLAADPWSKSGLVRLAAAAVAMDLPETEIFAWECLTAARPGDRAAGLGLAQAQMNQGRHAQALTAVEAVLKVHPRDNEALALMRKVSVAATIKKGKWDSADSFREKLRDPEESG